MKFFFKQELSIFSLNICIEKQDQVQNFKKRAPKEAT